MRPASSSRAALALAALAALAASIWFAIAHAAPGVDTLTSVAWGNVLSNGVRPELGGPDLPVSHPLAVLVHAVLTIGGPDFALFAVGMLGGLSLLGLLYACARLTLAVAGEDVSTVAMASAVAGVVAVLLINPSMVYLTQIISFDVPYAALIVMAVALVAERPDRSPALPLLLVGAAGLIRPEAWALSAVYGIWLLAKPPAGVALKRVLVLAIAPVVLWFSFDLAMTGSPSHTLDEARGGEARSVDTRFNPTDPPAELGDARWLAGSDWIDDALLGIPSVLGTVLTALALLGFGAAVALLRGTGETRPQVVAASAALVVGGTLAAEELIGVAVLDRYALPAAVCAGALGAGWLATKLGPRFGAIAGIVLVAGAFAEAPKRVKTIRGVVKELDRSQVQADAIRYIAADATVQKAVRKCPNVMVGGKGRPPSTQGRAIVALSLDRDFDRVILGRTPRAMGGHAIFRYALPLGPPPYVKKRRWVFRSKCLPAEVGARDETGLDPADR